VRRDSAGRITGRLAVIVLLALNVGLVGYALARYLSSDEPRAVPRSTPTATATKHHHTKNPLRLSTKAGSIRAEKLSVPLLFSAGSTTEAWRATGGCATPADLAVTKDAGVTWQPLRQPAPRILAVQVTGKRSGRVLGADETCTIAKTYTTTDGGFRWHAAPGFHRSWVASPFGVRSAQGVVSKPCRKTSPTPVFLSAGTDRLAVVVCRVGVFRTANGGHSWTPTAKLPAGRAAALAMSRSGRGALFLTQSPLCQGMRVMDTANAGRTWSVGPCLRAAAPPAFASMSAQGSGLLTTASGTYQTTDYGRSWV